LELIIDAACVGLASIDQRTFNNEVEIGCRPAIIEPRLNFRDALGHLLENQAHLKARGFINRFLRLVRAVTEPTKWRLWEKGFPFQIHLIDFSEDVPRIVGVRAEGVTSANV
jgi:hypothetical protein